jgi:Tfp pilus assembly protein PilX
MRAPERGSTLIVVLGAVSLMLILAVGAIRFTGAEQDASIARNRADQLRACAETARTYLLARLRLTGMSPADIKFADPLLDSAVAAERSKVQTGHYGDNGAVVSGAEVVAGSGFSSAARQARDLTNTLAASPTLGGQYYRVVVHCESRGAESEIEFLIRFGI